ncbi:DUF5134 domain-containing protein [Streptomyces canus]|uniref:DUF5134 domain-containing protein n=1 Tax=Streptomyces canus TaxID=58343 RepID=UPI000746BA06|nr:DUF5134 domain-containing protein [Streptomyces canus]KUN02220.1 hypothetical protein AQI96_40420 [Streptomyces canus]
MSPSDVVYCMLTAVFVAAAGHGLRRGLLSGGPPRRARVDHLLHAAMALAMAAMPWDLAQAVPAAAQVVFFAAAALWFPLTAVRRRESLVRAQLRRLPQAAGMAAMGWMAWTSHSMAGPSHETLADGPASGRHLAHSAGHSAIGDVAVTLLVLYLLGCALRSLTREMPALRFTADRRDAGTPRDPYGHFWDGSMALGTVIMLLMHH